MPHQTDLQTERARELRRTATPSEQRLKLAFRALKQREVHIRWNHPISGFYLDFYCAKAKLALEVDGKSHHWTAAQDAQRDAALTREGIKTLRVSAESLRENANGIALWFVEECRARMSGSPNSLS